MFMATLIKTDHMVSVYLLSFKIRNHKYAILDHMIFLFILKWSYEHQHDHKPLKVTIWRVWCDIWQFYGHSSPPVYAPHVCGGAYGFNHLECDWKEQVYKCCTTEERY